MAGVLPADKVIQVLNPFIKTGDFPVNQAAVKMLTKVAEHEGSKEIVVAHLESIMPGLLKVSINPISFGVLNIPLILEDCHS